MVVGPRAPIAQDDVFNIPVGCDDGDPLIINALANDVDSDGDPLTFALIGAGNGGTWTDLGNGLVSFTPASGFAGTATINYQVCDNTTPTTLCDTAQIIVTVGTLDVNGCLSNEVFVPVDFGYPTTVVSFVNVTNPNNILGEADELFAQIAGNNSNNIVLDFGVLVPSGRQFTLTWRSDGSETQEASVQVFYSADNVTYTSAGTFSTAAPHNEFQETTFTFPIATRYVRINRASRAPQLDAINYEIFGCVSRNPEISVGNTTILEDAPTRINVLNNVNDPAGSALTIKRVTSGPFNGKVSVNLDNTISYVTNLDYSGPDSLFYEVCNAEGYCSIGKLRINVIDDLCPAGEYKAIPLSGAVTRYFQFGFAGANAATANPTAANFRDTHIRQNNATNNYGGNTKMRSGYVPNNVNRILAFFNLSEIPTSAIVQSATYSMFREGGDNDIMEYRVQRITQTWNEAQVTWNIRATGTPWTTAGGDFGTTIWSTATVGATNKIRYSWNITDLAEQWVLTPADNHGMIIRANETLNKRKEFQPRERGTISERPALEITYIVPVPCAVIPNRPPLANPDFATTNSATMTVISPLVNDTDPDVGDVVSLSSILSVTNGSAVIAGNDVQFTPTFGFNGLATVIYRIEDNLGLADTSIIRIQVTNSPPLAEDDFAADSSGTVQLINVKANDIDPEGDTLSFPQIITTPKNATASVIGGQIQYAPNPGFTGLDTIRYKVCETIFDPNDCSPDLECDTAYVYLTIYNRAPIAVNDNVTANVCQEEIIIPLANDNDPENGDLQIIIVQNPVNGTFSLGADKRIYYNPNVGFTGADTIRYVLLDDGIPPLYSDTAIISISVLVSVNNPQKVP